MSEAAAKPEASADTGEEIVESAGLPPWLDMGLPWMVSVMLHAGVGLLIVFAVFLTGKAIHGTGEDDQDTIIVPSEIMGDPTATPGGVPSPGSGGDLSREAAQDRFKDVKRTDGWAQEESDNMVAGMISGNESDHVVDAIGYGTGGTIGGAGHGGTGTGSGGVLAPFGTPGGGNGAGPRSNFYGTGGNATKIVYILDRSGSMVENFGFLQAEVKKSLKALLPVQMFAVITFSEDVKCLGPKQLVRATEDIKKSVSEQIDNQIAQGENDDQLKPFEEAFREAISMKPQLVYFLTDGRFDKKLMEKVQEMNKDKKVHINTMFFLNEKDKEYQDLLKQMARENGGVYRFISEKDLGR